MHGIAPFNDSMRLCNIYYQLLHEWERPQACQFSETGFCYLLMHVSTDFIKVQQYAQVIKGRQTGHKLISLFDTSRNHSKVPHKIGTCTCMCMCICLTNQVSSLLVQVL